MEFVLGEIVGKLDVLYDKYRELSCEDELGEMYDEVADDIKGLLDELRIVERYIK